jgi:hypothetical protein
MEFSTDQRHAETLAFLREVRDYLAAWPPHPANRAFLARIDEHLDEPMHRLIASEQHEREAAAYTPAGRCVLQVHLQANVVTVSLPEKPKAVEDEKVIEALNRGIKLTLKPARKL